MTTIVKVQYIGTCVLAQSSQIFIRLVLGIQVSVGILFDSFEKM